ncbi:MAG: TPM domain-containing protein, partial [Selenomonadaceae bacterium]|nr:TPM domain-containing protein [Selenomonadaceae bacterium]
MIEDAERKEILAIGEDMDERFGAQLVVVTIDTLNGEEIEDYANRLFRAWGIGSAEKNNGVLLLIAKDDRKFRIEVGYGLEGIITDGFAGEVLDGMTPKFREGDYSSGILAAYQALAKKIYIGYGAEPLGNMSAPPPADTPAEAEEEEEFEWWEDILYGGIFVLLLLLVIFLFYCVLGPLIGFIVILALNGAVYILGVLLYVLSL